MGATGEKSDDQPGELPRVLSLRDATMLVVSSVIGVGIFLTPGGVAKLLPQPGWFCAAWVVGGILALAGALANAELGAMFPRAGGNYVYLRAAYHPMAGFLVDGSRSSPSLRAPSPPSRSASPSRSPAS